MELAGSVALVTGGSRGIGRATVHALAAAGAAVMLTYQQREADAAAVVEAIRAAGGQADAMQLDVADPAACARTVAATKERFGRLDILVNNAGTAHEALLTETTLAQWQSLIDIHLTGMFACTKAALPLMMERRHGRIITVSSIWGITGAGGEVAYSTVKAGQIGFTQGLAQEAGPYGITVNAVAPGAIDTEMIADLQGEALADWLARTPVGRLGRPDEVGALIRFLCGPQAAFITGQVISPNGGTTMW